MASVSYQLPMSRWSLLFCSAPFVDLIKSSSSAAIGHKIRLSISGSDQAREGRLVNALAVRGDERRDTLR